MSDTISKTSDATVPLSFSAAIEHLCEHIRQGIESCIPAQFIKYDDRDKNLAVVSPLVKFPYVSGNKTVWTERPQFTVRVLRVKSGGYWFRMPLKKGDTGWIIAADRDTSFAISRNANVDESKNTKENGGGPQEYSNFNKLKCSFGFFLPDGYCNIKVEKGHEDSSFWSMLKEDGSGDSDSYIELKKDGTVVIHPGGEEEKVLVEGFLNVGKNVDIDGTVTAEKKNADGTDNKDPVEIKETSYLIPIDKDKNLYAIWKGRSFRNNGETGKPFKLTGSGSIEGKLIKTVLYNTTEEGTLITFKYTDDTQDTFLAPRGPKGPQGEPGTSGLTTVTQGGGISVTGNSTDGYVVTNALVLTQGTNISITGNAATGYTISFTGSSGQTYTAGSGISISNQNVISAHWV